MTQWAGGEGPEPYKIQSQIKRLSLCIIFGTFISSKKQNMENSNVDNLIEEGKKQLATLQAELEKLANTAEKIAGVKAEEISKQAEVLISETKTKIEAKTKEIRETEEFKQFEADGKKAVNDLTIQLEAVTKDVSAQLNKLFGGK